MFIASLITLVLVVSSAVCDDEEVFVKIPTEGGKANATSVWDDMAEYGPHRAFLPEKATQHDAWWSANGLPMPQSVWYSFPEPHRVAMFSFNSGVNYADTNTDEFELVAANCSVGETNIQWTPLTIKLKTGFTEIQNELRSWMVAASKRDFYNCYGIRVHSFTSSDPQAWSAASLQNVQFYRMCEHCVTDDDDIIKIVVPIVVVVVVVVIVIGVLWYCCCRKPRKAKAMGESMEVTNRGYDGC